MKTGITTGMVASAQATLVLEITDTGTGREEHLPDPGPATTLRGTASDLMLALWRRRDPLAFHVDGRAGCSNAGLLSDGHQASGVVAFGRAPRNGTHDSWSQAVMLPSASSAAA